MLKVLLVQQEQQVLLLVRLVQLGLKERAVLEEQLVLSDLLVHKVQLVQLVHQLLVLLVLKVLNILLLF